MKFAMHGETLVHLGQRSQTESDDLRALVRRLVEAAEPLAGQMNGPAKAAFNKFKANVDETADTLEFALAGIVGSIAGQNKAFVMAAEEGAATHESADASTDYSQQGLLRTIGSARA